MASEQLGDESESEYDTDVDSDDDAGFSLETLLKGKQSRDESSDDSNSDSNGRFIFRRGRRREHGFGVLVARVRLVARVHILLRRRQGYDQPERVIHAQVAPS
jgi:pSer/pThr/pTyr-binding forkhead associated (FHA) protein